MAISGTGMDTTKDTIEIQSERVKEASQLLRNEIEDFLESGKTEGINKAIPSSYRTSPENSKRLLWTA